MKDVLAMANTQDGGIVMVSSVTAVLLSLLSAYFRPIVRECQSAYQSECGDHRLQERHFVDPTAHGIAPHEPI